MSLALLVTVDFVNDDLKTVMEKLADMQDSSGELLNVANYHEKEIRNNLEEMLSNILDTPLLTKDDHACLRLISSQPACKEVWSVVHAIVELLKVFVTLKNLKLKLDKAEFLTRLFKRSCTV